MTSTKRFFARCCRLNRQLISGLPMELDLHGLDDLAVLELAALEKRILVSSDQSTMPLHFAEFIQINTSYGLLIAPQSLSLNIVVDEILMIWAASTLEEWINRIAHLPL